jgi:hypothetical protein
MVDVQNISIVLTGIGLIVALYYYTLILRESNKARQAELYMQLSQSFRNPVFLKKYHEILYKYEWKDFDDWLKKYGIENNIEAHTNILSVLSLFETLGVLLQRNLIDRKIVEKQASAVLIPLWEKLESVIKEERKIRNQPTMYTDSEYLYEELIKSRRT